VSTNPLHKVSLESMKSWMNTCSGEHQDCSRCARDKVPLPTRLINMKGLPNAAALASVAKHENSWRDLFHAGICKLVETEPGQVGQYVALSYCWGACKLPFRTTSLNLERHRQGFRFARLPTTLQDAIMIARFLGYTKIWIDCVCIIQGDGDDWAREAARMTDIYSNAALCITVERAKSCDEGFLHARKREP
jgi:hypothetical protein